MLSSSHQPLEYRFSLPRFQSHARVADAVVACSTGKISTKIMEIYSGRGTIVHPDPEPHVLRVLVKVPTPYLFHLNQTASFLFYDGCDFLHGHPFPSLRWILYRKIQLEAFLGL